MTAPVTVRGRDLRALAAIPSEDHPDLPAGEGLPAVLAGRPDGPDPLRLNLPRTLRSGQRRSWFMQGFPALIDDEFKAH